MAVIESEKLTSKDEKHSFEFDVIFEHVASFGRYQILWLLFDGFVLIFPVTTQFTLLAFANGTPKFHCVTPNITCETKKCCDGCKSYEFDGPFHSTVSEVCVKLKSNVFIVKAIVRIMLGEKEDNHLLFQAISYQK